LIKTINIIFLLIILFLFLPGSGCLEASSVKPAIIDENALIAYGWSQVSIEEGSFSQVISSSTTITINSSTVKYRNDRLSKEVNEQILEFKESSKVPIPLEVPQNLSAQIITYRISLPMGITVPERVISRIMEGKINEIEQSNNIENLQDTTTKILVLADGTETFVKMFSASGNSTDKGLSMLGFVTAFESEGSSTIVFGLVPNGSYTIDAGPVNGTLFHIDGHSERNQMLQLVSTVE